MIDFIVSFFIGYYNLLTLEQYIILSILWEISEYVFSQTHFSYTFEKYYPIPRHLWDEKIKNKIMDIIEVKTFIEIDKFFEVKEKTKFAVLNGVIDVINMELLPHSPAEAGISAL